MIDFTVVLPVFNTVPEHLLEAVSSIINQSIQQDYTVHIVDDGSSDKGTLRMLRYLAKLPKVKVQFFKENVGVAVVLNTFHENCPNKYIAVCGSDDVLHPDKFKLQVEWLEKNPDTSVLSTNLFGFDNSDIERKPLFKSDHKINSHPKPSGNNRYWIANHGTVIYKNDDAKAAGGYDPALRRGQDVDLWKRMYAKGYKFQCLPQILYAWRRFIPE